LGGVSLGTGKKKNIHPHNLKRTIKKRVEEGSLILTRVMGKRVEKGEEQEKR